MSAPRRVVFEPFRLVFCCPLFLRSRPQQDYPHLMEIPITTSDVSNILPYVLQIFIEQRVFASVLFFPKVCLGCFNLTPLLDWQYFTLRYNIYWCMIFFRTLHFRDTKRSLTVLCVCVFFSFLWFAAVHCIENLNARYVWN